MRGVAETRDNPPSPGGNPEAGQCAALALRESAREACPPAFAAEPDSSQPPPSKRPPPDWPRRPAGRSDARQGGHSTDQVSQIKWLLDELVCTRRQQRVDLTLPHSARDDDDLRFHQL